MRPSIYIAVGIFVACIVPQSYASGRFPDDTAKSIEHFIEKEDSLLSNSGVGKATSKSYNWIERTFNTYDTTYVQGENDDLYLRLYSNNWLENYRFDFREKGGYMNVSSDIMTNLGISVAWKFIAVSYDENLNKFFNGYERHQRSFNLTLNSAKLNFKFYIQNNNLTADVTHFSIGDYTYPGKVSFNGSSTRRWGLNLCYFFNNSRYSQAAAFSYTRFQKKSQGSFFAGIAFYDKRYTFDFGELPQAILDRLPEELDDHVYTARIDDIFLTGGYAYNWVISEHWMLGISESPLIGYRWGKVNPIVQSKLTFSNYIQASAIYRFKRYFIGAQADLFTTFVTDRQIKLTTNVLTFQLCVGCHFRL